MSYEHGSLSLIHLGLFTFVVCCTNYLILEENPLSTEHIHPGDLQSCLLKHHLSLIFQVSQVGHRTHDILTILLAFYSGDEAAKVKLVEQVRDCCLHNGFFQITGHKIPLELQQRLLKLIKEFFALPKEDKLKVHKG